MQPYSETQVGGQCPLQMVPLSINLLPTHLLAFLTQCATKSYVLQQCHKSSGQKMIQGSKSHQVKIPSSEHNPKRNGASVYTGSYLSSTH